MHDKSRCNIYFCNRWTWAVGCWHITRYKNASTKSTAKFLTSMVVSICTFWLSCERPLLVGSVNRHSFYLHATSCLYNNIHGLLVFLISQLVNLQLKFHLLLQYFSSNFLSGLLSSLSLGKYVLWHIWIRRIHYNLFNIVLLQRSNVNEISNYVGWCFMIECTLEEPSVGCVSLRLSIHNR